MARTVWIDRQPTLIEMRQLKSSLSTDQIDIGLVLRKEFKRKSVNEEKGTKGKKAKETLTLRSIHDGRS